MSRRTGPLYTPAVFTYPAAPVAAARGRLLDDLLEVGERPAAALLRENPPTLTVPTAPCFHKQARHECGTTVRYVLDKCRCNLCTAANRTTHKRYLAGPKTVPAGEARRHVRQLMAWGMGTKQIAKVSGVPHGAVSALIHGRYNDGPRGGKRRPSRRLRVDTAAKLLACPFSPAGGAKVVPREVVDQLVAQLLAKGWWEAAIARRVVSPTAVSLQLKGRETCTARTALALKALLDEPAPEPLPGKRGNSQRRSRIAPVSRGTLTCATCGDPVAGHKLGQCRPERY